MGIQRIALFRYHSQNYDDLRQRVRFLRRLNPTLKVFGIFGGEKDSFQEATTEMKEVLEQNYLLEHPDVRVKALGGDIACQHWYRDIGSQIDFDVAHPVEWDLLFMDSLDNLYKKVPKDALGVTGLVKMSRVFDKWYWTKNRQRKKEWFDILEFAKSEYSYRGTPYCMQGPALSTPRNFLEDLQGIRIPEINVDEVRTPLWAQILGYKMVDNGFYPKWFDKKVHAYFNCNKIEIKYETIVEEAKRKKGRRVFHPYLQPFQEQLVNQLYKDHISVQNKRIGFFSFK